MNRKESVVSDPFITANEYARIRGVSVDSLANERWMKRGVPFYRIGGKRGAIRYRLSEVLAYMERNRVETQG